MATTTTRISSFHAEVLEQWRAAVLAQRAAAAAGDAWLAELMAGRLEDLRDLVRQHGLSDLALCPA
jgi:hypothetical protein